MSEEDDDRHSTVVCNGRKGYLYKLAGGKPSGKMSKRWFVLGGFMLSYGKTKVRNISIRSLHWLLK